MYRFLLFLIALITLSGCTSNHLPLRTVDYVDLGHYGGRWYEIARYEHSFEKGCRNVSATYTLKEDGDIRVVNRCTTEEGTVKEVVGRAYATDTTNSKLKVSFFRPFYGNYWVLMLDDAYSYALIGDPSREYLWILSRRPTLEPAIIKRILEELPEFGYDSSRLIWTEQDG